MAYDETGRIAPVETSSGVPAAVLENVFDDPSHGEPGRDRIAVHVVWEFLLLVGLAVAEAAVATKNGPMSGAYRCSIAARSTCPRGWVHVRIVSPVIAPWAPSSARAMCALDSQSTSWPAATRLRTASTLASVGFS